MDFANKEKITELLYPLFVHNIGALLYHPTNSNRTNAVMAAAERRKLDTKLNPPNSQPPSLHHHPMANSVGSHVSQPPHSIAPHPGSRPHLDRSQTFPTPPTSASSGVGMGNQGGSYDSWNQNMGNSVQSSQPLAIESHPHSTPNTPATTPPGPSMSMQPYQAQQPYDNSRPLYSSATTQQAQYAPPQVVQNSGRLGGPISYLKQEMGPPSSRAPGSGPELEHVEHKPEPFTHSQGNEQVGHGPGDEEAEHEHDAEYPHGNNPAYNSNRGSYDAYNSAPNLGSLQGEHPHLSPEITASPPHQNGSGRATPRTSGAGQTQWAPGFHSPSRGPPPSAQYSDTRASVPNGTSGPDTYSSASLPSSYAPLHVNGTSAPTKRLREEDDQDNSGGRVEDAEGLKRQKINREGSVSKPVVANSVEKDGRPNNRPRASPANSQRRR